MTRGSRILASAAVLVAALPVACGDTEANVIERAPSAIDGGGGTGGSGGSGGACTTPGGCAETGSPLVGECSKNSDCTNLSKPLCNPTLHTCAECLVDGDCVDYPVEKCSFALNRCAAPCSSDADCPQPDDPKCDLAVGRPGTPGYCVGCRQVSDCTNPDRPFCVEGDCVACANGQC